jgi:hypothetical protein
VLLFTWYHANDVSAGEDGIDFLFLASTNDSDTKLQEEN